MTSNKFLKVLDHCEVNFTAGCTLSILSTKDFNSRDMALWAFPSLSGHEYQILHSEHVTDLELFNIFRVYIISLKY